MTIDEHVDKALMMERPYGCVDAAGTRIYDLKTLEITLEPAAVVKQQTDKARKRICTTQDVVDMIAERDCALVRIKELEAEVKELTKSADTHKPGATTMVYVPAESDMEYPVIAAVESQPK